MARAHRFIKLFASMLIVANGCACTTLGYYAQSVSGQVEILQKRQPITSVLNAGSLPAPIARQLAQVRNIRDFARQELGLPDNGSYQDYVDLQRDYVVWNVFATPELALTGLEWCYLFVGCLSYRGYFSEPAARTEAIALEHQGYDVFVGGVAAYSTLGWFADPVLNTMLRQDIDYLARTIFHELAHQRIYIKDDTEFNEAFADTVAEIGIQRWLTRQGDPASQKKFELNQAREDEFVAMVLNYRNKLNDVYSSTMPDSEKRSKKSAIFTEMINEYQQLRLRWGNYGAYDAWFATGLDNAKLMAVATYRRYLPGFKKLLLAVAGDLESFYQLVEQLGACTPDQRRQILQQGNIHFTC